MDGGGGGGSGGAAVRFRETRAQRVIIITIIEQQKLREKDEERASPRPRTCGFWGGCRVRKNLRQRRRKDDDEEEKSSRGKENASREGEVVERMARLLTPVTRTTETTTRNKPKT